MATAFHAPGNNTAAVVTLPAGGSGSGVRHYVNQIAWSYSGAPVGGIIRVEDDGNIKFEFDIGATGRDGIILPFKSDNAETEMVITLTSGGMLVRGRLLVDYITQQ